MTPPRVTLLLTLLVILSGAARAGDVIIETTRPFATTRSDAVTWQANATIRTNAFTVTSTGIVLGSVNLDAHPTTGTATVYITKWATDEQRFTLTASATQAPTIRRSNAGFNHTLFSDGMPVSLCLTTNQTCTWLLPSGTQWNLSVRLDPTGALALGSTSPRTETPPPASGGGGAPAGQPENILDLPSPVKLVPRLTPQQWLSFAAGLVLFAGGVPRLRATLPPFLRVPGNPLAKLAAGTIILSLVYFHAASQI